MTVHVQSFESSYGWLADGPWVILDLLGASPRLWTVQDFGMEGIETELETVGLRLGH